uniref:Uncharacterized protein n=1 Tax=viral metagenome TaxID=1070528 RepID=A0A6C0CNM1_9ZZZZ
MQALMERLPDFRLHFGTVHKNQSFLYELAIISDDTETYGYSEFNGCKTDVLCANPKHGFDLDRLVDEIRRIYLLANN